MTTDQNPADLLARIAELETALFNTNDCLVRTEAYAAEMKSKLTAFGIDDEDWD